LSDFLKIFWLSSVRVFQKEGVNFKIGCSILKIGEFAIYTILWYFVSEEQLVPMCLPFLQ